MTTDDFLIEKEYVIKRVLSIHFRPQYICEKYRIDLDDLMQVGRIALWEAKRKYKPMEGGLSFDTYAHRIIKLKFLEYLRHLRRPIRQNDYSHSVNVEMSDGVELVDTIQCTENLEEQALDRVYLKEVSSEFNRQENGLFQQRIAGYTYKEIQINLGIKGKKFMDIRESMVQKIKNHQRQLVI